MSTENKNQNGEVAKESLVDSFNKHYTDYLERYSTNRQVVQTSDASDAVDETNPAVTELDDEDLFFVPEADEPVFVEQPVQEELPHTVFLDEETKEPTNSNDSEEDETVSSEEDSETTVEVEPEVSESNEIEETASDATPEVSTPAVDDLVELAEEEDQSSNDETFSLDDDDEDLFFTPENGSAIEDDHDDDLGFYVPENSTSAEPQPEPEPEKPQTVVEREVVREVLVVDRDQARDLGYGADRYMGEQPAAPVTPTPSAPSSPFKPAPAAPVVNEREVERNVTVRDNGNSGAYYPETEVQIRPRATEKSGGGFFKRNKDAAADVSEYVSEVSDYRERSRLREEGLTEDLTSFDSENSVISLKTQENYDPREERRRLQHIATEQRPHVDPAGWLEQTMLDALKLDASDLHIVVEGETKDLRARIRVDGQMQDFDYVTGVPAKVIMGRLKAATKLSSGGSFAPEETIYSIDLDGESRKARAVLFRVEDGGEALVMRLPLTGTLRQLDELAFSETNLQHVLDLLAMPYKLIMIAGPMGSGKTTTAHGALLHVADPTRTVWTIEDPVERRLPNLVQLEIDEENGAGFDVLLAKLLRADYNTLFLGEIRDNATASAAVRQAKAGRQVMSTIHADDNIKSLMRLIELAGDSPMSVLSAVGGVISQRLVRKLNPEWDGKDPAKKYKGRVPIHEILFVNDSIVEVMMQDRPLSEIKQQVRAAKGSTFADDANRLISAGVTDREEIVKVIGEFDAEDRY